MNMSDHILCFIYLFISFGLNCITFALKLIVSLNEMVKKSRFTGSQLPLDYRLSKLKKKKKKQEGMELMNCKTSQFIVNFFKIKSV